MENFLEELVKNLDTKSITITFKDKISNLNHKIIIKNNLIVLKNEVNFSVTEEENTTRGRYNFMDYLRDEEYMKDEES